VYIYPYDTISYRTPYTIFQGKKKDKHWMQIAEEEALFYRMIQEQIQQQAQATTPVAGAGGVPVYSYFNPNFSTLGFSISPSITGSAPYTVYLNPTSDESIVRYCNLTWNFSDGTSATGPITVKTFQTGSFNISLTASAQFNGATSAIIISNAVTASLPVVISNFTSSVQSGSVPLTVNFINLTTINQYTSSGALPGVTYKWSFGSGSVTSTQTNPTITYYNTGSYIVKLESTGSYGMTSSRVRLAVSAST
jgi:PKD repeat protein